MIGWMIETVSYFLEFSPGQSESGAVSSGWHEFVNSPCAVCTDVISWLKMLVFVKLKASHHF